MNANRTRILVTCGDWFVNFLFLLLKTRDSWSQWW